MNFGALSVVLLGILAIQVCAESDLKWFQSLTDHLDAEMELRRSQHQSAMDRMEKLHEKLKLRLQDALRYFSEIKPCEKIEKQVTDALKSKVTQWGETIEDQYNELENKRNQHAKELEDMLDEHEGKEELLPVNITNCYDLKKTENDKSGVYQIQPEKDGLRFRAYCDMEDDGGGWTVIHKRDQFDVKWINVSRDWRDYKNGFGDLLSGNFWLGNEKVHLLTRRRPFELRIDMRDFEGVTSQGNFNTFQVGPEEDKYKLSVKGESSQEGDERFLSLNGEGFETPYSHNCNRPHGGFWGNYCVVGGHLNGASGFRDGGLTYDGFTPLAFVSMKIRPYIT